MNNPTPNRLPSLLVSVALIFVFNGAFALLQMAWLLFDGQEFVPDWRMLNVLVGMGLLARKRSWYVVAFISLAATTFSHIYWLYALEDSPASVILYLFAGLVILFFQFYILMRADIRALYFPRTEKK
jgi:hypothetical protein